MMLIHSRRSYMVAQLAIDILSFWPIWELTKRLRVALNPLTIRQLTVEQAAWVTPLGVALLLFLLVSYKFKLFNIPSDVKTWSIVVWAAENTLAVCGVSVLACFFVREFGSGASRIFIVCLAPVTFLVFLTTRLVALAVFRFAQRRPTGSRLAIVGDPTHAIGLIAKLKLEIGSAIRGVVLPDGSLATGSVESLRVLGTTSQIAEVVNTEGLDSLIVINDTISESELLRCNEVFWRMGLPVSHTLSMAMAASASGSTSSRVRVSNMNGVRVVDVRPTGIASPYDFIKRGFDAMVSFFLLVLLSPVLLLLAILVKLESPGPVFEKAPRVGKGGRHFACFKFRTTIEDLNQPAPPNHWNRPFSEAANVHHVSGLGEVLRRYSLDELPQLYNVLIGDMSLVGPRPLPAHHLGPDGMSQEFYSWSSIRARVKPGVTGLWQIGGRNTLPFDKMIELDLAYVRRRSLLLDLAVLIKTPLAVLSGLGAN